MSSFFFTYTLTQLLRCNYDFNDKIKFSKNAVKPFKIYEISINLYIN